MSDTEPLRLERRGGVAILTIDREARRNSLSRELLRSFGRMGETLVKDRGLRAIVLTAAGDKAFCAGADLKERQGMSENDVREVVGMYRSDVFWLRRAPMPVIAAINGVALGGGLELALLCDLRVAAAHAILGLPEVTIGIIPGAGGTQTLPRIIGEARAKEMILFGKRLSASEAFDIGLVNRVTPAGESVLDDTLAWIEPLIHGAPIAQSAALRAIDAAAEVDFEHGAELERTFYDECLRSSDRVEALDAFAEKRKPKFEGK